MNVYTEQGIATIASLCLPFPIRPGYLAQIVIPRDMSKREAERLCAFVMSLAKKEEENQSIVPAKEGV